MKQILRYLTLSAFMPFLLVSCGSEDKKSLTLTADKIIVTADGVDAVSFTVKYGDEDVTSTAGITDADGTPLTGASFSTTEPGTYVFRAEYDGQQSADLTITAQEVVPLEMVLSVDKATIVCDGEDMAVFTVMLGNEDITGGSDIYIVGGESLPSAAFTTVMQGEYEFRAVYTDDGGNEFESANSVKVDAVSEEFDQSRELHRNVAFFTLTGTWCFPCYTFKTYIKSAMESYGEENFVQAYFYTADSEPKVRSTLTSTIRQEFDAEGRFTVEGYPTIVCDFRSKQFGTIGCEEWIDDSYNSYITKPARVGIMVNSLVGEETIDIVVTVGAKEADTYHIGIMLTEDNLEASQYGYDGGKYNHDDVFRARGTSTVFGEPIGAMSAGGTKEIRYSFSMLSKYTAENLHLVVYIMYEEDGGLVIANSVKAPANGYTPYKYAE